MFDGYLLSSLGFRSKRPRDVGKVSVKGFRTVDKATGCAEATLCTGDGVRIADSLEFKDGPAQYAFPSERS
jgi:hypothetical protein